MLNLLSPVLCWSFYHPGPENICQSIFYKYWRSWGPEGHSTLLNSHFIGRSALQAQHTNSCLFLYYPTVRARFIKSGTRKNIYHRGQKFILYKIVKFVSFLSEITSSVHVSTSKLKLFKLCSVHKHTILKFIIKHFSHFYFKYLYWWMLIWDFSSRLSERLKSCLCQDWVMVKHYKCQIKSTDQVSMWNWTKPQR